MKNISRRVFIKGMAVAAVATAASTVLTGCKFPGVDEPIVEVPVDTKVFTYTDPKDSTKTFTLNFSDMIKGNADFDANDKNKAVIKVEYNNKLGSAVTVNGTTPITAGSYQLLISTYRDGYTGMDADVTYSLSSIADKANNAVKVELDLEDVKSSVTFKVTLVKTVNSDATAANVATEKLLEKEITYTL